jgi:HupE / UreJ protein
MKYLLYFLLCAWSALAIAHKPSDSYLSINVQDNHLTGRWDIALRDLDFAIGLDNNDDGTITWGELRSKSVEINDYVFSKLQLSVADNTCFHQVTEMKVDEHTDGNYAVLLFISHCDVSNLNDLTVGYRLFSDLDPQHRGLLNLTHNNVNSAAVLVPSQPPRSYSVSSNRSDWPEVYDFIHEGIWHIWIGYDHILFLFSLLIPSVMVYQTTKWRPVVNFNAVFWDVLKVVTAFTLAHSITLSLAVLDVIDLPSRWVESCIAASVILAALNNIVPIFTDKRALLAFAFGLIHGFGFASVLTDLGLKESSKLWSLLGFNVGVEIGQLALVIVFLPIAYKFSRYPLYKPVVLKSCSLGIAGLATFWLMERAFDISINV